MKSSTCSLLASPRTTDPNIEITRETTITMTYQDAMRAGQQALLAGDPEQAFEHFTRAHALGHGVRSQHIAAHAAMMRASWHGHHPRRLVTQLTLWGVAHFFNRAPALEKGTGA
jgi:hypothetical protein